jgi:hypothetical protein
MSTQRSSSNGYSADVRMHLSVNGHTVQIGQLGPDFIILDDAPDLSPSQGEITMSIDGRVRRWHVALPDGVSASRVKTRIAKPA